MDNVTNNQQDEGLNTTQGAQDSIQSTPQQTTTNTDANTTSTQSRTFTQEEVNALMKKEKESGRRSILKELGVEDTKTAKEGLAEYKRIIDSQKSDAEKLNDSLVAKTKEAEDANKRALFAEAKVSALSKGANPKAVNDLITLALAKVTEDKTLEDVVDEMKKDAVYNSFFTDTNTQGQSTLNGTGTAINHGTAQNSGSTGQSLGARIAGTNKGSTSKSSYFAR